MMLHSRSVELEHAKKKYLMCSLRRNINFTNRLVMIRTRYMRLFSNKLCVLNELSRVEYNECHDHSDYVVQRIFINTDKARITEE